MFIDKQGNILERIILSFDIHEVMADAIPHLVNLINSYTSLPHPDKKLIINLLSSCLVEVVSDISMDIEKTLKLISAKTYSYNMYNNLFNYDYEYGRRAMMGHIIDDVVFSSIDEVLKSIAFKVITDMRSCYNLPLNTKFNFHGVDAYSIHIIGYLDETELL